MKRFAMMAAGAALAMLVGVTPALAKPIPAAGLTRQEVATWLRDKGYPATVHTEDGSTTMIVTSTIADVNFDIYFYGCVKERCTSIEFLAGWTPAENISLAELNAWNAKRRYAFGYRDEDENLWVQIDMDLAPGGTWEMLNATLTRWGEMSGSFKTFIDSGGEVE